MVYLDKLESHQTVGLVSRIGQGIPLHATALGKAYLAALPDAERIATVKGLELTPRTERTVTDPETLLLELKDTRDRGFALDDAENEPGVRCVGAALYDSRSRPVGAISVSAPTSRFSPADARRAAAPCAETAQAISAELGASPEPVNAQRPANPRGAVATR
jgi:DNA-binding IclR family transcriptional regulator